MILKRIGALLLTGVLMMTTWLIQLPVQAEEIPKENSTRAKVSGMIHDGIKILIVGNSFSYNTSEAIGPILEELGFSDFVLANWRVGGTSLDDLWHIKVNQTSGIYRIYQKGRFVEERTTLDYALEDQDWEIITINQKSVLAGVPESFYVDPLNPSSETNYLNMFYDCFKEHAPNAKVGFVMNWTYRDVNNNSDEYATYDKNQTTMFNSIASTTTLYVNKTKMDFILPVGTGIQNLKTSYYNTGLYKDYKHLSTKGEVMAGLTVLVGLGCDISNIKQLTVDGMKVDPMHLPLMIRSAQATIRSPFWVTPQAQTPPSLQPVKLTVTTNRGKRVYRWKPVENAIQYKVQYRRLGSGSWKTKAIVAQQELYCPKVQTYTHRTVLNDVVYESRIVAVHDSWVESISEPVESCYITAPTGLKGSRVMVGRTQYVHLNWQRHPLATGYLIYRSVGDSGTYKLVKTVTSGSKVSWTDTRSDIRKVNRYRITAVYKSANSGKKYKSKYQAKVTVKALKPTTVKKTTRR